MTVSVLTHDSPQAIRAQSKIGLVGTVILETDFNCMVFNRSTGLCSQIDKVILLETETSILYTDVSQQSIDIGRRVAIGKTFKVTEIVDVGQHTRDIRNS